MANGRDVEWWANAANWIGWGGAALFGALDFLWHPW